ncbi:MAG: glycoside hydrolase family 97 catalytic domain-containing protein, partial [Acidobacteria bacterium]|nr:glycoside hydrolase family 97 catalytic domain-containing protein [Acidobacteriota bacterium]
TIVLNLNEPSRIADTSWIKPGKTTWHWWNGTEGEPAGFATQLDLRTMKHYVDFCARHGIAYHAVASTVDSDSRPWYQQTQRGFAPGPDTDILKPRPELEFEELARYAASKGVGLRAWVHWKALKPRLDEAFAQYERWGLCGLMVDFLDRDDQEMVEFAEQVLEKAAQHRLHIQFHGVWKPTGRERAYPNLFNHEGVLNLEYLKWSENPSPEHNLMAPFTRMLAGPMDYHLGGFRAVRREKFKPRGVSPTVMGTRTHHLAMYVVYENPMPMVCDYPTAYENQPGFDFIERVPTVWDETRVLSAQVGDYIVVARRNANDWYLGAMTDWTPRSLEIPLDFLGPGSYVAEIWSDAPETAGDPNVLVKDRRSVSAQDTIRAKLSSGGGWVLHVKPAAR